MGIAILNHFQNVDEIASSKYSEICNLTKAVAAQSDTGGVSDSLGSSDYVSTVEAYSEIWIWGEYSITGVTISQTNSSSSLNASFNVYLTGGTDSYNPGKTRITKREYSSGCTNLSLSGSGSIYLQHFGPNAWFDWYNSLPSNSGGYAISSDCIHIHIRSWTSSNRSSSWTGGTLKLKAWGRGKFVMPF